MDPFLSEARVALIPSTAPIGILRSRLDYLLVTHEHLDRLDVQLLPVLIAAFPTLTIVVSSPVVSRVTRVGTGSRSDGLPNDCWANALTAHLGRFCVQHDHDDLQNRLRALKTRALARVFLYVAAVPGCFR